MRQVLAWIRARGARQISREDVRRDALGQALNAHQALQVIQSLERAGFLRRVEYEPDGAGRPPLRWDVNPAVIGGSLAEIAEIRPPDQAPKGRVEGPSLHDEPLVAKRRSLDYGACGASARDDE